MKKQKNIFPYLAHYDYYQYIQYMVQSKSSDYSGSEMSLATGMLHVHYNKRHVASIVLLQSSIKKTSNKKPLFTIAKTYTKH